MEWEDREVKSHDIAENFHLYQLCQRHVITKAKTYVIAGLGAGALTYR